MAEAYCVYQGQRACKKKNNTVSISGAIHPVALIGLFALFLAGVGYVYALNRTAVGGYAVRDLETEITELRKERKRLEIEAAERRSLARIEETAKEREMRAVESPRVLEGRHSFALR
jgi:cell division protein FtsL